MFFSHKEKWSYVICRKIDGLTTTMLSEISQAQKAKCCTFLLICAP
jgi:hypothetical protein